MATDYDNVRKKYKPSKIITLFIAESQPPAAGVASSRQFYRTDILYREDRLFTNTMQALYPDAATLSDLTLKNQKESWLRKFQSDGYYMIEALEVSLAHEVTKKQRQALIATAIPRLLERVEKLVNKDVRIILIKSNVFEVAADAMRTAGFNVINRTLLDYPGRFNQKAYRDKLTQMLS